VGIQLADALASAHASGVIHRDLKPANVALTPDGKVKVLDFGLAKIHFREATPPDFSTLSDLTPEGRHIMGTPPYMSPEQILGQVVDERSDLYSFGILLFELLTGQRPFHGKDDISLAMAILNEPTPKLRQLAPSAPPELEAIVSRAMARRLEDRYGSAHELGRDLQRIETPVSATTLSRPARAIARWDGRRRKIAAGAILAIVAGAAIVRSVSGLRLSAALQPAPPEARRWYEQGTAALREGAYLTARRRFEKAISLYDAYPLAHARLAEARAELDDLAGAKDSLLYVQTLVPDLSRLPRVETLNLDGIRAMVGRRFAAASGAYAKLVESMPDDAQAHLDLGRALDAGGDTARAKLSYEKAARLEPQVGAPLLRLGILQGQAQELDASLAAFAKAEALYQAASNFEGMAEVAYQRGTVYNQRDRLKEARTDLALALRLANDTGNTHLQIRSLLQLSSVAVTEGTVADAEQLANEAIALARGMETLASQGLIDLGNTFFARGNNSEAERYFQEALTAARRFRGRRAEARALLSLGSLRIQADKIDEGVRYVEQALPFYKQGNFQKEASQALMLLGQAYDARGALVRALAAFEEQLTIGNELKDQSLVAAANDGMAAVLMRCESYPEVLTHVEVSKAIYSAQGSVLNLAYTRLTETEALAALGRIAEARLIVETLAGDATRRDSPTARLRPRIALVSGRVHLAAGQAPDAERDFRRSLAEAPQDERLKVEASSGLGLAEVTRGRTQGVRLTADAVARARDVGDPVLLSCTLLAHAQVLVSVARDAEALVTLREALEAFAKSNQRASAWQANILAARAAARSGSTESSRTYEAEAERVLSHLERSWTPSGLQGFLGRKDIRLLNGPRISEAWFVNIVLRRNS
jgi:tetratricopeptide (TPR) repeat protein